MENVEINGSLTHTTLAIVGMIMAHKTMVLWIQPEGKIQENAEIDLKQPIAH